MTGRKISFGQGNVFTRVCHYVHGGGVCLGGLHRGKGYWADPPPSPHIGYYGIRAGGRHPTGMHSCCNHIYSNVIYNVLTAVFRDVAATVIDIRIATKKTRAIMDRMNWPGLSAEVSLSSPQRTYITSTRTGMENK